MPSCVGERGWGRGDFYDRAPSRQLNTKHKIDAQRAGQTERCTLTCNKRNIVWFLCEQCINPSYWIRSHLIQYGNLINKWLIPEYLFCYSAILSRVHQIKRHWNVFFFSSLSNAWRTLTRFKRFHSSYSKHGNAMNCEAGVYMWTYFLLFVASSCLSAGNLKCVESRRLFCSNLSRSFLPASPVLSLGCLRAQWLHWLVT